MIGFVLIIVKQQIHKDIVKEVMKNLLQIDNVVEVNHLFGIYDLIVKIQYSKNEDLGKFVIEKLRNIDGVGDTKTLVGSNLYE